MRRALKRFQIEHQEKRLDKERYQGVLKAAVDYVNSLREVDYRKISASLQIKKDSTKQRAQLNTDVSLNELFIDQVEVIDYDKVALDAFNRLHQRGGSSKRSFPKCNEVGVINMEVTSTKQSAFPLDVDTKGKTIYFDKWYGNRKNSSFPEMLHVVLTYHEKTGHFYSIVDKTGVQKSGSRLGEWKQLDPFLAMRYIAAMNGDIDAAEL